MIKAIFFDLDGVLVEAVRIHFEALNAALREVSNTFIAPSEESEFNGIPTKVKLEKLHKMGRIKDSDKQIIWDKKQKRTMDVIGNVLTFDWDKVYLHTFTRGLGLKSVCVTNSITDTAKLMLEKSGQWSHMSFMVSNQMVNNPKPHGEGYIRAMIKVGAQPEECLIVEDSDKGLAAAKATGAHIWKVRNSHDVTLSGFKKAICELFGDQYLHNLINQSVKKI